MASPRAVYRFDGRSRWLALGPEPCEPPAPFVHDPMLDLQRVLEATSSASPSIDELPFCGGWIGTISYELGRWIEPTVAVSAEPRQLPGWPLIELAWCPNALVFDHLRAQWWSVGAPAVPDGPVRPWCRSALAGLRTAVPADQHLHAIARARRYIAAGDIFQANITQPLQGRFAGSTRALFERAMRQSRAWYGAYMEWPGDRAVISMSPELFLQLDANRRLITRPIKGTRAAHHDQAELLASAKDAAELHMIVDLMRNDLGRVCEIGSVRVPVPREIESHPSVHHGVATIEGVLRAGISVSDLLRATFPPGSITGAPKIRAMQIIEELEETPRGPYCGAIGLFSDDGQLRLNVAIRTARLSGERRAENWSELQGTFSYGVGGGIVADSQPREEYRESMDKAAILRALVERPSDAVQAERRSGSSARAAN